MAHKNTASLVGARDRISLTDLPDICNGNDLEAATGIPAATWRYYAYSSQGPAWFKAGRHRLYRKESVLSWISAQEAKSASGA